MSDSPIPRMPWHPRNLREASVRQCLALDDLSPIRVAHLVSNTLRIGPRLQTAFEQVGRVVPLSATTHAAKSAEDLSRFLSHADLFEATFLLVQVHGIEGEQRLLEPVLGLNPLGCPIVYVHRPEELILRVALEGACSYAAAKRRLAEQLRQARAVVLPGECYLREYQDMLPDALVTFIPLGFVPSESETDLEFRLRPGAPTFVGSATSWGEMRHLDDLDHLMASIRADGSSQSVTGYVSGRFDAHCRLLDYAARPEVVLLGNAEITRALADGLLGDEKQFRRWMNQCAPGKTILRARVNDDGAVVPESLPEVHKDLRRWEERLIDFNVQLYWEILDPQRDPPRRGLPKVEYSGTLHKGTPYELFVVFESAAMGDVERDEGLAMIKVPASDGVPDFDNGAQEILHLIKHPNTRAQMLRENQVRTKELGMQEVAWGFYALMRHLAGASANQREYP